MKTAILIAIGLMASVGLGYILVALQRWILKPRHPSHVVAVLPVFGDEADIEQQLRSAYTDLLQGAYGMTPILLIADFGADVETLTVCTIFCQGCSYARICSGDDLPQVLKGLQNK
ncbi:hypothetical protein [Hydrogenoanaerobacterium sp.]|uniref:hypothetical protein n=1 Tax=Hydrogenoanaerobacterium sp. TaxID=2953763 RepID=UPI00289ECCBB|nr:hypothetical protein [Hydrogenoanaerobacterium sp.]